MKAKTLTCKIKYAKYALASHGRILKDGHTMFCEDVVSDLNRKSYLEAEVKRLMVCLNKVKNGE